MKRKKTLAVRQNLSDRKLRMFLHEVANAEDQQAGGSIDYFISHYSMFFPTMETDIKDFLSFCGRKMPSTVGLSLLEGRQIMYRALIEETRDWLRAIWSAEDKYTAEWQLFNLQRQLHRTMDANNYRWYDKNLQPPPLDAPINQALRYLNRHFDKLRRCGNTECKETPFFVAKRGKQSYCSAECAAGAQQEYKRRWWKKNGPSWREARRKKEQSEPPQRKTTVQNRKKESA